MRRNVTIKTVFSAVKLSLIPVWGWPIRNPTKLELFCVKLHHCFSVIMLICLIVPLILGILDHFDDPPVLVSQIVILGGLFHTMSNTISHMINYHTIQKITFEMVDFCDLMEPYEEVIIQQYIDKCLLFHSISMFSFYLIVFFLTAIIPPFMHQPFPIITTYPFDVFYQPLRTIVYIQQSMVGLLVAGQLCMNIYMALLIWLAAARFEMLAEELRKIINVYQLFECIKKHQKLLQYAREVTVIVRPIAFTTICCRTISSIISFCLIVTNQPLVIVVQFIIFAISGLSEVFMYTWPAEHLIHKCKNIAETAFYLLEKNDLLQIWKCLQILIMRSQKPIVISIPCFLPMLSLNYFTSYLSTILSYFATLRIMMIEADD